MSDTLTQGSALLYILLLTVIPVTLALLIALPLIADVSKPGRQARDEKAQRAAASALSSRERSSSDRADRAALQPAPARAASSQIGILDASRSLRG